MCEMTQEVDSQEHKGEIQMWTDRRLGVRLMTEDGYGSLFGGKDPNSGLTSGFSTITVPLRMMH
jgi:hypothetical protein